MPLPDKNTIVCLSDVSLAYNQRYILQHLDFSIAERDFIVVSGANGGGKTTMLRLLLKLLKPTLGSVTYYSGDKEVDSLHIGYLPQKNMIDSRFPISVKEVVFSGLYTSKNSNTLSTKMLHVDTLLQELGLDVLLHRPIGELSGGELQRTLLARAVISQPQLLVLDEPFSYIDEAYACCIRKLLSRLAQGCAIVMVTHHPDMVADMATRILKMDAGRLSQ